jgi:acyl-CoA thioesterase FadM
MFSVEIEVQFRDVDLFGRVNSAVVTSYMETERYRYLKDRAAVLNGDLSRAENPP